MKQRIQSPHIPPCHRRMVIATILSVHCPALLHRSANQKSAKRCLELTTRGGHRMFPGLPGSALTLPLAEGRGGGQGCKRKLEVVGNAPPPSGRPAYAQPLSP